MEKPELSNNITLSWKSLLEDHLVYSVQYYQGEILVMRACQGWNFLRTFMRKEFEKENCNCGTIFGEIPNFSAFQKLINLLWRDGEEIDLRPAGKNLFVIQFMDVEKRDRILEKGSWHIQNQLLVVRKWEQNWEGMELNWTKVPIRVHLKGMPLELFTHRGIGYLPSVLGVPFYMDRFTTDRTRLKYASVLEVPFYMDRSSLKGWSFVNNYVKAENGRIWIFLKRCIQVDIHVVTTQCITIAVNVDNKKFFVSAVYVANYGVERRNLWSHLMTL
ncbi:hypothetical protein PTKIN_Ptkin15bG0028100 [Pterospermum kingtungense]